MFLKVYHEQRYQNLIISTSLRTLSAQVLETLTQTSLNDRDNFISSNRKCRSRMGFRIVSGSDLMVPCFLCLPVCQPHVQLRPKTGDHQILRELSAVVRMLCFLIMSSREERGPLPDRANGSSPASVKLLACTGVGGCNVHWAGSAIWVDILPANLALSLFLHPPHT